jgi:hypothetical protein
VEAFGSFGSRDQGRHQRRLKQSFPGRQRSGKTVPHNLKRLSDHGKFRLVLRNRHLPPPRLVAWLAALILSSCSIQSAPRTALGRCRRCLYVNKQIRTRSRCLT